MIPHSSALARTLFPMALWKAPNETVCLTFDDGPHPRATPLVLDTLQSYGLKGTFFFLGTHVAQYPELAREAVRVGHTVGNHSYDHSLLLFRSHRFVTKQVTEGAREILNATGSVSSLFRPPYGYFRPTLLRALRATGHRLVMWSLDPKDWKQLSAQVVAESIIRTVRPGSIILLHDNHHTAGKIVDILKRVLDSLLTDFNFSTLPHDR